MSKRLSNATSLATTSDTLPYLSTSLSSFSSLINSTRTWLESTLAAQSELPPSADAILTAEDVEVKRVALLVEWRAVQEAQKEAVKKRVREAKKAEKEKEKVKEEEKEEEKEEKAGNEEEKEEEKEEYEDEQQEDHVQEEQEEQQEEQQEEEEREHDEL